jgi:signal transduction histidine kinase
VWRALDGNLRARILIPTALFFAATMLGMGAAAVRLYGADMEQGNDERAELFADMVANGLTTAMLQGDQAQLPQILEVAAGHRGDVESVSLLRPTGDVAFSSRPDLLGSRPWPDLRSMATQRLVRAPEGDAGIYSVVVPIENREACARCHGSGEKLNGWLDVRFSRRPVVAAEARLSRTLFWTGVPALLLLLAIAWWLLGREAVAPLRRLVLAMRRAEAGEPEVRADEGRPDELGVAARGFDATLKALRRSKAELEDFYKERMINAERFAAVGELATGLAHEIKNPLAGLSGALEVIGVDLKDSPRLSRVIGEMRHQVSRMARTMEGLLDFTRPTKAHLRSTDVNYALEKVLFLLRQQTRDQMVAFEVQLTADLPAALADSGQLEQVFLNVCLNAVQAMKGRGRLSLRTRADDDRVCVEIADDGPGIAPTVAANLFKPFHTTKPGGSGLGLALSARIVAEHGGQIGYHCPESGGTVFTVKLRRALAANGRAA